MAVLGCSIPIASFYCRRGDIWLCVCTSCGPKFGDFRSIPLPTPVAELQIKDDLGGNSTLLINVNLFAQFHAVVTIDE